MAQRLTEKTVKEALIKEKRYDIRDSGCQGLFLRVEVSGVKTYHLNYRDVNKRRLTVKIGPANLISPSQAREKAQIFLASIATNGIDPRVRKEEKGLTVRDLINAYSDCHESEYVPKLVTVNFTGFLDKQVQDIKMIDIQRWRTTQKGVLITTINKRVVALNALLNWAKYSELIKDNPIKEIKRLKENDSTVITRYLSDDERKRLLEALENSSPYLKALVLVAMNTGIRRGALFNLKWNDINLEEKTVTLRSETAKSGKSAVLPLNKTALETLQGIKHEGEYIFTSPRSDTRLNNVSKGWLNLMKRAKIENFRFHDLRHDFASRLVMRGVDLNTVRELMTHSDIKMTLRYAHLAPEKTKSAVDLLD